MALDQSGKPVGSTYTDLLKVLIGIQSYKANNNTNAASTTKSNEGQNLWSDFFPDFQETSISRFYSGNKPLMGKHAIATLNFNNVPLWGIIDGFVSRPVNEMYTCLRVDNDGYVLPTLVVRQVPMSTPKFISSGHSNATGYLDIPRWYIDPKLITQTSVGVSNNLRLNYMFLMPNCLDTGNGTNQQFIYTYSKPFWDPEDIKRSGLRPMFATVGATINPNDTNPDSEKSGTYWNRLMADMCFGGHLKYTGTIVLKGINEPICEGDNCVVDNIIFHIERVMHNGSIDGSGRKEFNTIIQVSNGIDISSDYAQDIVYPLANDDEAAINFEGVP